MRRVVDQLKNRVKTRVGDLPQTGFLVGFGGLGEFSVSDGYCVNLAIRLPRDSRFDVRQMVVILPRSASEQTSSIPMPLEVLASLAHFGIALFRRTGLKARLLAGRAWRPDLRKAG